MKRYIKIGVAFSLILGFSLVFTQQVLANQAPTAVITIYPDKEVYTTNDEIRVDGYASTDPDGHRDIEIDDYLWEIHSHENNVTNTDSGTAIRPRVYPGTFDIRLKVVDNEGLYHIAEKTITIVQGEYPPVARFSYTGNKDTKEVIFDASELSFDEDGQITEYKWNFGDGTEQIGSAEITHRYDEIKPYAVGLTVTDDDRRSDTFGLLVVPMSQTELLACAESIKGAMNTVGDAHSHKVTFVLNLTSEACPEFASLDPILEIDDPNINFGGEIINSRTEEENTYTSVHYKEPGSYVVKASVPYTVVRTYSAERLQSAPQTRGSIEFPNTQVTVAEPEFDRITVCTDGLDNDGDGAIDYPEDEECSGLQDDDEGPAEGTRGLHVSFYTEPRIVQPGQETKIIVEVAEWAGDSLRCGLDVNPRTRYISGKSLIGICEHTYTFSGGGTYKVDYSVSNRDTGEYLRLEPIIIKPGSGEVSGSGGQGSLGLTTIFTTNPSIIEMRESARITAHITEWKNDRKRCILRVDGNYAGFAGFWSDEDVDRDIATCSTMHTFENSGRYDVSFSVLNNRTKENVLLAPHEIEIVEDKSFVIMDDDEEDDESENGSDISFVTVGDDPCPNDNTTDCPTTTDRNYDITIDNPLGDGVQDIWDLVDKIITLVQLIAIPLIVLFIVYAGFLFVTSQGDQQKLTRAKKALLTAVIGSLIILGAEAISQLIQGTIDQLGSGT